MTGLCDSTGRPTNGTRELKILPSHAERLVASNFKTADITNTLGLQDNQ